MEEQNSNLYQNQIQLTGQFRFCGNAFRADTYRGCDMGCKYCFANNRNGKGFDRQVNYQLGDHEVVENYFHKMNNGEDYKDINVELMRRRVPIHLGGMADPFQTREWTHRLTYKFLMLSKEHKYPVNISTKAAYLEPDYYKHLDPTIHAFQVSLIGVDKDYIRQYETNTPEPMKRIEFIKDLKARGFWVAVRIQPLIDVTEAERVLEQLHQHIDYCTIEHLKISKKNSDVFDEFIEMLPLEYKVNIRATPNKPEFELNNKIKLDNVEYLRSKFKGVKFGCGDNDLHQFSDSLNCCGVDTMPPAFKNWLKYNSMYIKMTKDRSQWTPSQSCNGCFNSGSIVRGNTYSDYVEDYYMSLYGDDNQLSLF